MRAISILLALLVAACGSVHDRGECSASADCAAGTYCAHTGDGNVCWPDAVSPEVSAVTVRCDRDPCLRSGVLHVEAMVSDDAELAGVEVTLDVGGPVVAMGPAGNVWAADVPLTGFPFEYFTHDVVATVTARDGARNETKVAAGAVTVTRLRFERAVDTGVFALTTPAVMDDGTVVAAGTNGKVYFVPWDGTGVASIAVGGGQITAAPLALGGSVWIGSEDDKVYEVNRNLAGMWGSTQRSDDTGGSILGSLALTNDDRVLAATESGFVYAVTSTGYKSGSALAPFSLGPVVDAASIFVVSGGSLRRLTLNQGATEQDPTFGSTIGFPVALPLAVSDGIVVAVSNGSEGLLKRVSETGGEPTNVATTAIPSGGVVVVSDGSILVPEQTSTLSRWTSSGAAFPGWIKRDLGGAARTPLVLTGTSTPFIVSTSTGVVQALDGSGEIVWTGQFGSSTASLQPGNIYTPPGQPEGETLSIAYFAGADGVLHAVIVDGKLDGNAPWPKAFHDPRNTNRAGPQP